MGCLSRLGLLEAVHKGPCAELAIRPLWSIRGLDDEGLIEPYETKNIEGFGLSIKWTLSPKGREEMKRLQKEEKALEARMAKRNAS